MQALNVKQEMGYVDCADCHMVFGMPATFIAERRNDHKTFYCPTGHTNYYPGLSEKERLQKKVAELEGQVRWNQEAADRARKNAIAQKAQATRAKNKLKRVHHGVCPDCNRSFQNLRRHMEAKHA